ncbi:MAG TPA: cAMP/cGMP-dependent 3',5'-cyclic-AMP/GMP phosphodiesterase [Spirochaetota bacterium]|nr:cAMP/cGMP-dependent 3',5'-cyclic-AMP/GMP phosphodiesterase [Spirochaetota bacterium]HOD15367.1 cAMP/cGMP-dependent 3',5'-cyclic-AMP/GMP phosphodiesterase [Spirochaetota bacterium]HPG50909.1 cAMP/cGMP-dependent 3',5'-cyclic-AMP/GMP phosphodiesterase [Spirochaetota bacterium]HPN13836.1 cAMP/cGMP-dependent 3',5'-cyclic-AMP/GMP phosphodiesterase [Spirochaetota bacterium]
MTEHNNENVTILPRGGYLVDTPLGYIQFGSPPETIKDTMRMQGGVPQIFVLTDELFNWMKGISIAEIEFPIYYNFFLKKRRTTIICREDQFEQMKKVLQEAIFGPKEFNITGDYDPAVIGDGVPEIRNEMDFFRRNLKFSDLLSFGFFKNNKFTYQGITIEITESGSFRVSGSDGMIAMVPARVEYKPKYLIGKRLPEPYRPPLFGVTCLGPSHGFDPEENTSGFIVWLNHSGIMVDPPVNSTEWLVSSNVNPKLTDSIILTHCHADHDAGTFQKILEEQKVTVYTTETVMMSFLRKYSGLSNMPISYLMRLFNFHPVKIGKPTFIHGGRFDMFYTLHSIPTIGFKMNFQDQTFVYSSDHNNDPEVHEELLNGGHITRRRYDELRNFPWDSKVIYHESGIAPLHTPITYLNSLPKKTKKRIVVYHIAKKDFPAKTALTLAKFGMENTLYFKTSHPRFETAYQIMGVLKNLDFFEALPLSKAQEFLDIVEEEHYRKGEKIISKGTQGDKFYIIYSGNVSVDSGGLEEKKIYGAFDYFGEVALVTEQTRAADVIAETDLVVYTITRDKFLNFIVGTEFEKTLTRLARIRNSETWNLLSTSAFFRHCTSSQKTWLESMFVPVDLQGKGEIIREGGVAEYVYIIRSGEVEVSRGGGRVALLKRGDLVGSVQLLQMNRPEDYTFSHWDTVSLFGIKSGDMKRFIGNNPGLLMKLVYDFSAPAPA